MRRRKSGGARPWLRVLDPCNIASRQIITGQAASRRPRYDVARPNGGRVVSSRADEYRRRAQQCLEMAAVFRSPQARVTLAHIAQAWLRLADNYEARPVVQQQQQIQPKKGDL